MISTVLKSRTIYIIRVKLFRYEHWMDQEFHWGNFHCMLKRWRLWIPPQLPDRPVTIKVTRIRKGQQHNYTKIKWWVTWFRYWKFMHLQVLEMNMRSRRLFSKALCDIIFTKFIGCEISLNNRLPHLNKKGTGLKEKVWSIGK